MSQKDSNSKSGRSTWLRVVLLVGCIAVPVLTGVVAAYITRNNMVVFEAIEKPPLTPPSQVFPIAWTILYVLMGLASYFALAKSNAFQAIIVGLPYVAQLILNFLWSMIFFSAQNYMTAFFCLLMMWVLIIASMVSFKTVSKLACYLMIPYLLWVTFAGYLNLSIALMNK